MKAVIDASAMLAFLHREPGHEVVREWLHNSAMSAINFAEVLQKLVEKPQEQRLLNAVVSNLRIDVLEFNRKHAEQVAAIYPNAHRGISIADRACMAVAIQERLPIVTDDHEWEKLNFGLELIFFRPKSN